MAASTDTHLSYFFPEFAEKVLGFQKEKDGTCPKPHYCSCNVALQMSAAKKNHQTKKWSSPQLYISVLSRKEGKCNSCLNIHVQIFFTSESMAMLTHSTFDYCCALFCIWLQGSVNSSR